MKILHHGSNTAGVSVLEPRISLEYRSLVYATPDLRYAMVRAGKQLDMIREEYYGLDEPFELAECYPDVFKNMFERTGYIYLLNSKYFVESNPLEYISEKSVRPIGCIAVKNLWSWMMRHHEKYDFKRYYDEQFWATVKGGLEGYLQRKRAAKMKMMEMQVT